MSIHVFPLENALFNLTGGTRLVRRIVEFIPLSVIGPVFNILRKAWKNPSKPAKYEGLKNLDFEIHRSKTPY